MTHSNLQHGTPDYRVTAGARTTFQLTDLAELAVRLGSPIRFDRRGDVIWWDDFECATERYDFELLGTGAAIARTTERAHGGEQSYKLTGGSDGDGIATLIGSEPAVIRGPIGLEVAFNLPGTIDSFEIRLVEYDGANGYYAAIRWSDTASELQRRDATAAYVAVAAAIDLPVNKPTWMVLKMVVDLSDHTYVRAILNDRCYNLSGLTYETFSDGRAPRLDFTCQTNSRAGSNDVVYVDDLILTQNEPV